MEKEERRGVEHFKYNMSPSHANIGSSSIHSPYPTFNMSADVNSMFNSTFNNVNTSPNHINSTSLMNDSGLIQFSAHAETAQSSPGSASVNNSSRYSAEANSPLGSLIGTKHGIAKVNVSISETDHPECLQSPSTSGSVSPGTIEQMNSPAASNEQIPNSPCTSNTHGENSSLFRPDINQTPQLPPYTGGYFHNILASYHGYRNFPPQTPELDQAIATNIAHIAKSVVQGGGQDNKRSRDKPFQCSMCHKRYTNRAGLTVHVLSHTGDTSHACTLCSKRFTQKSALEQHMLVHANQRPYECKICYKAFTQKTNLNAHMIIHNDEDPYQCRICDKRFTQRAHLSAHISTHSENEKMNTAMEMGVGNHTLALPYPVGPTHTNEMFQKYNPSIGSSLQRDSDGHKPLSHSNHVHNVSHSNHVNDDEPKDMRNEQQPSPCDKNNDFSQKNSVPLGNSHPYMNSNFTNNQVNPILNHDNKPNDHENTISHHGITNSYQTDTFQNILTNIRNSFVGNVRAHASKVNDNKERPFQCMFCEKRFTQRAGLNAHVLIHSGTRPFQCTICDKRFTQKSGLDQHFLTHTGERPHQCPLCHKRFTQKANLNHHILTHTGEKRHVCPFCERRFTQKANLNAHILTHTGLKPHQCMVCDRKFTQKSGLNQHILTHTGEKPYTCKLCDKSYTQKSGLDVHMYSHSGEKPYRCEYCDKQFVARTLWVKHLRANHDHDAPPATNAYGRGGHGGMNLISPNNMPVKPPEGLHGFKPPVSLPGFKPTFDMLKNAPDLLKPPPSDCFKLLHESYHKVNGDGYGVNKPSDQNYEKMNKSANDSFDMTKSTNQNYDNIHKSTNEIRVDAATSSAYKSSLSHEASVNDLNTRRNEDVKSPSYELERFKALNESYSHNSKYLHKESLSADLKQAERNKTTNDKIREDPNLAETSSFDDFAEKSSRGALPFGDAHSKNRTSATPIFPNGNYSENNTVGLKRRNTEDSETYNERDEGQGQTGYKPKTPYVPGHISANEKTSYVPGSIPANQSFDNRFGSMYPERYMSMYRDMMTSHGYLPDASPAFI